MTKVVDVYWTTLTSADTYSGLLIPQPKPALSELSYKGHRIMQCPAFQDYYSNMYTVQSPFAMTLSPDGNFTVDTNSQTVEVDRAGSALIGTDEDFLFLPPHIIFFTEEPCLIELVHPTLSGGELSRKEHLVCGTFDISKWFRPVHPVYTRKSGEELSITYRETLMYVKFRTDKRVNLHRFHLSEYLKHAHTEVSTVKHLNQNFYKSMQNYYDAFKQWGQRGRLIREIKENVCD